MCVCEREREKERVLSTVGRVSCVHNDALSARDSQGIIVVHPALRIPFRISGSARNAHGLL